MEFEFSEQVQAAAGPLLEVLGFTLDEIDGSVDEGGRRPGSVVYYRSSDCRI